MRFDPFGLDALFESHRSDGALQRHLQPYDCRIGVEFAMSAYKIEPLHDWEWGYRAALQLMWHHRWVLIPLAIVMSVPSIPISGMIMEFLIINFSISSNDWLLFGPRDLVEAVIHSLVTVALISLFLKSAQITSKWRTKGMAVFVLFALEILKVVFFSAQREFWPEQIHPVASALVSLLATAIAVVVVTYTFCLGSQILVDGQLNLSRSYKVVARRGWRLWFSLILVNLLSMLYLAIWGILGAQGNLDSVSQSLLPFFFGFVRVYWMFWTMAAAALSTIWFLHPRVRPPEESTTWEVPTITQPG